MDDLKKELDTAAGQVAKWTQATVKDESKKVTYIAKGVSLNEAPFNYSCFAQCDYILINKRTPFLLEGVNVSKLFF